VKIAEQNGTAPAPATASRKVPDAVLEELWEIKRRLNAAAGYDVAILAAQANRFDIDAALAGLDTKQTRALPRTGQAS
jgi:hypothetical protein